MFLSHLMKSINSTKFNKMLRTSFNSKYSKTSIKLVKIIDFETLKYLLLHPTLVGGMINYKNSEGKTPLNLAKTSKITNFLLSKGAQQSIKEDLIKEPLITENEDPIGRYFTTPASSAKIGEQL